MVTRNVWIWIELYERITFYEFKQTLALVRCPAVATNSAVFLTFVFIFLSFWLHHWEADVPLLICTSAYFWLMKCINKILCLVGFEKDKWSCTLRLVDLSNSVFILHNNYYVKDKFLYFLLNHFEDLPPVSTTVSCWFLFPCSTPPLSRTILLPHTRHCKSLTLLKGPKKNISFNKLHKHHFFSVCLIVAWKNQPCSWKMLFI